MHTVELLPDPALDQGVRELWALLHDAGLPSLATHRHPTNRPHLTLFPALTAETLRALKPIALPVAAELGRVRMLGRALVREVTLAAELRDGDWVPHVSLALKVPPGQRDAALDLLAAVPPAHGQFVAARSYDTQTRTVTSLAAATR